MNTTDSEIIKFVRFPLIVWVVFMHSILCSSGGLLDMGYPVCSYILGFVSVSVRVPIFFFISGYCFFIGVQKFSKSLYFDKLKRRVRSLIIPYFIWNGVVIGYFVIAHTLFPELINDEFENVSEYSWPDYFAAFYNKSGGQPIAYQLWFLRDLIQVCILTPLIYFIMRKIKLGGVLLMLILYINPMNYRIPLRVGIAFFSIGAYFPINGKCFSDMLTAFKRYGGCIAFVGITIFSILFPKYEMLRCICVIFYGITVLCFVKYLVQHRYNMPQLLTDSNYFIYLWHGFPIWVVKFVFEKILRLDTGVQYLASSLAVCLITTSLGIIIYWCLNKYLPRITSILVGKKLMG